MQARKKTEQVWQPKETQPVKETVPIHKEGPKQPIVCTTNTEVNTIEKTTQGEDDGWRVVSRRKRDPRTPISMNLGFAQVTDDQTRFSFDGGGGKEGTSHSIL